MTIVLRLVGEKTQNASGFKPALTRTGERGRPSWNISEDQLKYLLEYNFTVREIAALFGVSYRTIRRRMAENSLSVRMSYSDISDDELRRVVTEFTEQFPNSGIKSVSGYLRSVGLR